MSLLVLSSKRGPRGSNIQSIQSVSYHRNGVGGQGFYAVEFTSDNTALHAIVINAETDADAASPLEAFVTTPGKPGEAWRGTDHFGPALREICRGAKWPHEVKT